jgi:hypothetical protein
MPSPHTGARTARASLSERVRSSIETAFTPEFDDDRASDRNSWPAVVTDVSVTVRVQAVGSAWPSSQRLNWIVEPLTRIRTHCFAVVTWPDDDTVARSVVVPFTAFVTVTVFELDENSTPYPLRGRYAFVQPPDPRRFTLKYAEAPVALHL